MITPASSPVPVESGERIQALDVVRGFALLGVLISNINSHLPVPLPGVAGRFNKDQALLDNVLHWFIAMFVDGRFYTMFSLLFGAGFVIFIDRARARGGSAEALFMRRLTALALIGLAHGVLIWHGDILLIYACLGFLLLAFINMPWQRLWKWGLAFYAAPTALLLVQTMLPAYTPPVDAAVADAAREAQRVVSETAIATYTSGTWWEATQLRVMDVIRIWRYFVPRWIATPVFGMFLLGVALVRSGALRTLHEQRAVLRCVAWVGVPAGALLVALYRLPISPDWPALTHGLDYLAGLLQCLAYVSILLLLLQSAGAARRLRALAPVGRMALSNYLAQSLVFTWIFCGYGLGIGDSLGRAATTGIALAFFAGQVAFSHWWLARFRFGPMEWMWRTMTYGHRPPLRIAPTTT